MFLGFTFQIGRFWLSMEVKIWLIHSSVREEKSKDSSL